MRRHTLLIDADDTLWENNVFFEKLIEDFISIVEPYGYTRAYIRHILNETERKNIRQFGYGVRSFGRSLEETYIKLADQMAKRETLALIHSRVIDLERTPPKILDGVPETLAYLTERHRLILFTKEMDKYMAAADLMVGKAGGLTTSEAMARALPMALIDPIPGQEERNADHLLEAGAAIRCNNLPAAAWKIAALLDDPARLGRMRDAAKNLGRPRAAEAIAEDALRLVD